MTGDTPTIDDWAAQHLSPGKALKARPDLYESARRGRELGLTFPQIVQWLALQDFVITAQELNDALR